MASGKIVGIAAVLLVVVGLWQMAPSYSQALDGERVPDVASEETAVADPCEQNAADHEDPQDYVWNSPEVVHIALEGSSISVIGAGVVVDGSTATITRGGTYDLHGVLADGQIIVDSTNKKTVRLILDGADIRCSWNAPIVVENAKKTVIVLAEATENYVGDGRSNGVETPGAEEPNAAIFSHDDLSLWGSGSLTVSGGFNDGISSKDGLVIAGGVIDINAVDDGIRGKDYLVIRGGTITAQVGGDGLKSDNDANSTMGYISVEAGTIDITSGSDAIQAETDVLISGGQIALLAGGGSSNSRTVTDPNASGITAGVSVIIHGGSLTIDSADDAIHSDGLCAMHGGTLALSTLDDAVHADSAVDVNDGSIQVIRSYEGIESNAITVGGGDIQIVSSDDGIVSGQSLSIEAGTIKVTSGGDALSAETDLRITDGQFTLTSGGGSGKTVARTVSAKGIKGTGSVVIDGGTFTVDSADDTVHSNGDVTINGGTLTLSAANVGGTTIKHGQGIHADANVVINGGEIQIVKSYEGIESGNANVTINDGAIHITSSDDGINISAGGDTMGLPGGGTQPGGGTPPGGNTPREMPMQPGQPTNNCWLYINGGYLYVDALGDGLDSNGSMAMTAGTVIVNGPTASNNGALDYSLFPMTGGFLVAAGSSGMAMTIGTTSTQYGILLTFNTTLPVGTLVHIQNSQGEDILTFKPTKQYNSVAFSSPNLAKGTAYDVYYGGSCTGTVTDGLYEGGTYTPGTKYATFTISSIVTNVGSGTGTNPGGSTTPRVPR